MDFCYIEPNAAGRVFMDFSVNWHKNRYIWAYGAAILLHALLFFVQIPAQRAVLSPAPAPAEPPLIFEFVDVPEAAPNEEKPEPTPLLAARNQISRDQQSEALPQSHLPASAGISQAKEAFETVAGQRAAEASPSQMPSERAADVREQRFNFGDVLRTSAEQVQQQREQAIFGRSGAPRPSVAMDNSNSRALEQGGLQLSTYAWNFAPYMAYLKQHIGNHIFLPRAFDLGLIDGTTQVRFRILRDGTLDGLEVLGHKGNVMLRDTSTKAVSLAAQYKPLPVDFPDAYLDVIGTFEYIILR